MVEMVETAYILNQATSKSLIILDEIGRGTSTYDGLAIAQSVAEFIHNHPLMGCKTLFATHYHEMTTLSETFPRIKNYNVAVSEENGEVVFLRQVVEGGANKSYGIHVAKLAGIPGAVISRAWDLLMELESSTKSDPIHKSTNQKAIQLPMIEPNSDLSNEIRSLDIASLTPIEAITKLYELQMKTKGDQF
jgi:DNA mismatch repair protein MutS